MDSLVSCKLSKPYSEWRREWESVLKWYRWLLSLNMFTNVKSSWESYQGIYGEVGFEEKTACIHFHVWRFQKAIQLGEDLFGIKIFWVASLVMGG